MTHSYLLAGIRFGKLMAMLRCHGGVSWQPKYWIRLLFLLQNGIWSSVFARRERKSLGSQLQNVPVPDNPVFIVGHWRTGSTFLHQLLSLDNQWITPTVFEVSLPNGFLVSQKYYRPVMSRMMGTTRPMDNVKLGFDEPQEDEYALLKLVPGTPLENLIFAENKGYFLKPSDTFMPTIDQEPLWRQAFEGFCRRLLLHRTGRLLFKNPFHSLRIPMLYRWFPGAVFINITRHPREVLPSTRHMWDVVGRQNCLNGLWVRPSLREIAVFYNYLTSFVDRQLARLPSANCYTLSYGSLTDDPFGQVEAVYRHFGWDFSPAYQKKLSAYISNLSTYKKNSYSPDPELENVLAEMGNENFVHIQNK